jgi:septum formation protein
VATATTEVTFRRLDEPTLDWYVASGEWRERAGGYAIQGRGAALIERIDGDYTNVVGLPVVLLLELLPDLLSGAR